MSYETKDSGERAKFESGMVRDTQTNKARFDLLFPEGIPYGAQFLTRVAELLARGAVKYSERNWEQASGNAEMDRFKASAARHLAQWMAGDEEEDHAAAVVFNLMGYETTKWKIQDTNRLEGEYEELGLGSVRDSEQSGSVGEDTAAASICYVERTLDKHGWWYDTCSVCRNSIRSQIAPYSAASHHTSCTFWRRSYKDGDETALVQSGGFDVVV